MTLHCPLATCRVPFFLDEFNRLEAQLPDRPLADDESPWPAFLVAAAMGQELDRVERRVRQHLAVHSRDQWLEAGITDPFEAVLGYAAPVAEALV
jgi:hypothetical protein